MATRAGRTHRPRHKTIHRPTVRPKGAAEPRALAIPAIDVLVATDGSRASNAALKIAKLMADRNLWVPRVVTVFEPLPVSVADMTLGIPAPTNQQVVADSLLSMISRQVRRHGNGTWNIRTEFGRSAPTIVRAAKSENVELIVLGLGHHGKLARWLGAETAARVARHSHVPVLAVDAKARDLPETILVAIDFGESSIRAARESAALLGPRGRLHLLHVKWGLDDKPERETEWDRTYDLGVDLGFKRLVDALQRVSSAEITTQVRRGGTIETTLKVAAQVGADVIALGSHNQNIVDRMVIGYTPGAILRAAHCSVLIAPPVDRAS